VVVVQGDALDGLAPPDGQVDPKRMCRECRLSREWVSHWSNMVAMWAGPVTRRTWEMLTSE